MLCKYFLYFLLTCTNTKCLNLTKYLKNENDRSFRIQDSE